jgi:NAD(P)-dependent dehydrogenase (short-subunit alcohol dehydrogenase family)
MQRLRGAGSGLGHGWRLGPDRIDLSESSASSAPLGMTEDCGPATAVVIGASGGVGRAICELLRGDARYAQVLALGRSGSGEATDITVDITNESSIDSAAAQVSQATAHSGAALRLVLDATGFLHGSGFEPEKSWRQLDAAHMAHAFAVNAIGPALLMKHFLPLLPRSGRAVFASLSAKVGSIGDNRLGGWYSYRASKAALNQLVRTAAIELARRQPQAICVALHPGTVATRLSQPFAKSGLEVQTPAASAARLLATIDGLSASDSGGFFNHRGEALPW